MALELPEHAALERCHSAASLCANVWHGRWAFGGRAERTGRRRYRRRFCRPLRGLKRKREEVLRPPPGAHAAWLSSAAASRLVLRGRVRSWARWARSAHRSDDPTASRLGLRESARSGKGEAADWSRGAVWTDQRSPEGAALNSPGWSAAEPRVVAASKSPALKGRQNGFERWFGIVLECHRWHLE
jgi:hypothetical protein